MDRLRWGAVRAVLGRRPGAIEVSLVLDGARDERRAIAYPALVGDVGGGDRVLANVVANELDLGTGGLDVVVAVERGAPVAAASSGRQMKLRYTPHQVNLATVDDEDSRDRDVLDGDARLEGTPVVWIPLHSMLAPAAAGAIAAGARAVAYVMTDHAALPAPLSRVAAELRAKDLLSCVVSSGQAFGGDLEAVSLFSALLAARRVAGAEVVVVGDGPGSAGAGTTWGASALDSALSLVAAAALGARPVAALRISFADPRSRHRGVSHHSLTALTHIVPAGAHVAVPATDDAALRKEIWDALRAAELHERHQLVEATGAPALALLRERDVHAASMGRTADDDALFFEAAGAAGVLAGRMAVGSRPWTSG